MRNDLPQSNPACPICSHRSRAAGAAMIKCGASGEEVAAALQVTAADVEIHFRDHAPIPSVDLDLRSASDNELAQLLHDSTELYLQSVLQNSLSSASSALSVRARVVSQMSERESALQEKGALLDGVDPRSPCHLWPRELAHFVQQYTDGLLERFEEVQKFREEASK